MSDTPLFKNLQENLVVDNIAISSAIAALLSIVIWKFLGSSGKQSSNVSKNVHTTKTVPLTLEGKIENIALRYENEFKDRIIKLVEIYDNKNEKLVYERNYCNEMLLKLLIELDGVDLVDIEPERKAILKQKRKDIIKVIQKELSTLDCLK